MNTALSETPPGVPPIVRIVLSQLARLRAEGTISDADFEAKVSRLDREELSRRGLNLSRRELAGGRVSFQIRCAASGQLCETVQHKALAA